MDSSASGITKIRTADINNDNLTDILITQGYNVDEVGFYLNQGNGDFSGKVVIDSVANDPNSIVTGHFNQDEWPDVAVISHSGSRVFWMPNDEGTFNTRLELDSGLFLGNGLAVADFDGDQSDDIVSIGQHSISLFRNDGDGNFNKEPILTTDTSPNSLECLDIQEADMDNDGDVDVIVSETIGGVFYENDGTGNFTPHVFTSTLTSTVVHLLDADGDELVDVILFQSSDHVRLFMNQGDGNFSEAIELFNATNLQSITSSLIDGDAHPDILAAPDYTLTALFNEDEGSFAEPQSVFQDDDINITEVATADLNNDGVEEIIWSGINGPLAFQENTTVGLSAKPGNYEWTISPNPATQHLTIQGDSKITSYEVHNSAGRKLLQGQLRERRIDISGLDAGLYVLRLFTGEGIASKKFIKK